MDLQTLYRQLFAARLERGSKTASGKSNYAEENVFKAI